MLFGFYIFKLAVLKQIKNDLIKLCFNINQSTDSTGGSIVSESRLRNGSERGLKIVSFHP